MNRLAVVRMHRSTCAQYISTRELLSCGFAESVESPSQECYRDCYHFSHVRDLHDLSRIQVQVGRNAA